MDRPIKFRGKRIDNGEWVYGYFALLFNLKPMIMPDCYFATRDFGDEDSKGNLILEDGLALGAFYDVDPSTVGQLTGLKDRNGKEIYEGDVVKVLRGSPEALANIYQIKYTNAAFQMWGKGNDIPTAFVTYAKDAVDRGVEFFEIGELIEVIGNIHEHKNLL